jgi:hypothetical protein
MKHQLQDELAVTGTGVDVEGTPFCVVPSQSEVGRSHLVRQLPSKLLCDCKAARYGCRCAHVAAVVAHKQRQQLAIAQAEDVTTRILTRGTARLNAMDASDQDRTPAGYGVRSAHRQPLMSTHPGDTAILRRSQKPFSLLA